MIYPRLTALLTAASLAITGCDTEQTPEIQSNLSKTLKVEPRYVITKGKNSITSGNNTITLGNDTVNLRSKNPTNNAEEKNNNTAEVNKDRDMQLLGQKKGIEFTEKLKFYIGRLLIALGYPTAGAFGYLMSRRKLEKMLHGEYGKNTGQLIKFLSNRIPIIKITNIREEIIAKNIEFSHSGTIPKFSKDYEKIQILTNKFPQQLENLEENYNYDKIIEDTENLMNLYIEFREVIKYYRQLKDNYDIKIRELNNELSKLEKASNRKIENTKNNTDQDKLIKEYNEKINSTILLSKEINKLYNHLNDIENIISPMFDPYR